MCTFMCIRSPVLFAKFVWRKFFLRLENRNPQKWFIIRRNNCGESRILKWIGIKKVWEMGHKKGF